MQRRRVHSVNSVGGVGADHDNIATIDESNGVNAHGLRVSFICEPEDSNANATGLWVLFCLPDETSSIPVVSSTALEAEGSNAFIWALGTWAGSNETPYCSPEIAINTSRNCQNGARLVLRVNRSGVSAGQVRIRSTMTYFTTSL